MLLIIFLITPGLLPVPTRRAAPPLVARRELLALPVALPALLGQPRAARAAAIGSGQSGSDESFTTLGGGPPKLGKLAPLTKGEPGPEELKRLQYGYARLNYLLANWEKETTVCIRGCKGRPENCGCVRDPVIVQSYMGYKSMSDPLFRAGDLMLRASSLVRSDADFERYTAALETWNNKADSGNVMAYVSSWGEANPGGGQDEIARYLEKSRLEVVESAALLKTILQALSLPLNVAL